MAKKARARYYTEESGKFNIKARFQALNNAQKKLLRQQWAETFELHPANFYEDLEKEVLDDETLQFFADMFGCAVIDLYSIKPPVAQNLFDLERRAKIKAGLILPNAKQNALTL